MQPNFGWCSLIFWYRNCAFKKVIRAKWFFFRFCFVFIQTQIAISLESLFFCAQFTKWLDSARSLWLQYILIVCFVLFLPVVVGEIGVQSIVVEEEGRQSTEHHCLIHKRRAMLTAGARRPNWAREAPYLDTTARASRHSPPPPPSRFPSP